MTRKVTRKKSASASENGSRKVVKDAEINSEANHAAIAKKDASGGKPKVHAKVVHIIVSVGTEDRGRTHEQLVEEVKKRLGLVKYGEPGLHGSVTGGYYILDGKVCMPEDYDVKKGTFKKGAYPPSWAGGPLPSRTKATPMQEQMQRDAKELSSDAYDKKYGIGKYTPKADSSRIITPDKQKAMREQWRAERLRKEEAELEELEDFLDDDEAMGTVADESASRLAGRMKSGKKRVVKKKPAPKASAKKVVRRVKK